MTPHGTSYKNAGVPLCILFCLFSLSGCVGQVHHRIPPEQKANTEKKMAKPPSSFENTLRISTPAAVFYQPDSLQLEKIRGLTDERIFKGSMHEFYYQVRNAHIFLKQNWPKLRIVDASRIRYLLFQKADKTTYLIDLNTENDAYGLFVFDGKNPPRLLDMTNVESQVPDYFSH